jgi:hypothetical protein
VIDAVTGVADEEFVILLAWIARRVPRLAETARGAFDTVDHPRARQLLAAIPAGVQE